MFPKFSRCFFLLTLAIGSTAACGADSLDGPDAASMKADARTKPIRADAKPFDRPDARIIPDGMAACTDEHGDIGSVAKAKVLGNAVSDKDSAGGTFVGKTRGSEVDWFVYTGSDGIYNVDPSVQFTSAVEVCMYLECVGGALTTFTCPDNTTASTEGAIKGCCGESSFSVEDLDCASSISEDAKVLMRVMARASGVCESYSVDYHY